MEEYISHVKCEVAAIFVISIPNLLDYMKHIGKVRKLDEWAAHKQNNYRMTHRLETRRSLLSRQIGDGILHHSLTYYEKRIIFINSKHHARCLDRDGAPKRNRKICIFIKISNRVCLVVHGLCHPV